MDYNKTDIPFFSSSYNFELSEFSDTMSCSSKHNFLDFDFNSLNHISDEDTNRFMLYSNKHFILNEYPNKAADSMTNNEDNDDLIDTDDKQLLSLPSKDTKTTTSGKSKYNKGRWYSSELRLFVEGLVLHGNEWKKIQTIIKTRSATQTRSHAQKFFLRLRKKVDITQSSAEIRNFIYKYIQGCIHQSFKTKKNFYDVVFSILFTPEELKLLNEKTKNTEKYFLVQKVYKTKTQSTNINCLNDKDLIMIPLES